MQIAEKFSNSESIWNLGITQMIQLLKLPVGEEEKFIEEKAAYTIEEIICRIFHPAFRRLHYHSPQSFLKVQ